MKIADRIASIPPYLFAELDKRRAQVAARGVDVINLGIGDPDRPTFPGIVERMRQEVVRPEHHAYPAYEGARSFREACATYLSSRFGVDCDPDREIMAAIGSKEAIAHLIWAFVDRGDVALIPDPAYPVVRAHTLFCGGEPYSLPLRAESGFLPDLEAIPAGVARRATILYLNYPNNPTAAVADLAFFERAVDWCRRKDVLLCHDAAYTEITFDGFKAPSVLEVPGAKDVAIEIHSLSKTYNMTGWRIAFAAGSAAAIRALGVIKTNTDSGPFTAVQMAAAEALLGTPPQVLHEQNELYARRRDVMVEALRAAGVDAPRTRGSVYLWCPVPGGESSAAFCGRLLEETGVLVTPGNGYGAEGEGYFRISLTVPDERLREAARRIRDARRR
ncbi:LL-diaminopimelate aminotransferase [Vulgatibacter incomptus]|uniref:Aminotransferase n=1 Tax=Vulgatibacter incomptus TaxID=1391653 RepID=A0A0K1PDH2_9BACT|nr:LL-diaminopimelate aminotransferase [Vulgatibacter incomptus]AKU91456.1 Aspartate aminotransferase [Vulgatibacter incomptus]